MVNGIRFEDRLVGALNFVSWKFRVMLALGENELDEFVKDVVSEPKEEDWASMEEKGQQSNENVG